MMKIRFLQQASVTAIWLVITACFALPIQASDNVIKKSNSGICHAEDSRWYSRTKNFTPYDTLDACLKSGGRLPKGYKYRKTNSQPTGYQRSAFNHWVDKDGDCLNERHELLEKLSTGPVHYSDDNCRVVRGRWNDPYTGRIFFNSSDVDVDHVVALKRAWDTGASSWSDEKRERFANDPINLLVVDDGTNQSKGAKSVLEWLPPNEAYHCNYVTRYLRVLITYELEKSYQDKVRNLRQKLCAK
ncbi:MAG: HNH endonuclease [Idiomarina sp.]|uniref:HNH endonuclease family protein n=1 Tax=Idiomarina sp. TaxID=1874361 RepID=UPI000C44D196|nr:HNH endonuclease family protein [Idiomarina sp.]MBT43521.1 HNH endonuclease [Idiomarina sp.]